MKSWVSRAVQPGWVQWMGRCLVLALGSAHTVVAIVNQSMNEDGIAYLDLGDAWVRGQWGEVLNTTWSPLYAVVVGAAVNLAGVSPASEFRVVQLVNLGMLVVALVCFEFFWRRLWRDHALVESPAARSAVMPESIWWAVGYSLFGWSALNLIEVWAVTPDMLVAALVYLSAGMWVSAWQPREGGKRPLTALGLVLAVGYYAKAVLFPLGIAFIAIAAWLTRRNRLPDRHVAAALLVFLVVTAPLIIGVSAAAGYPTFSDVGRFTYLKHVNAMPYPQFEAAAGALGGSILHGPRTIFASPTVFEFAQPVAGTYPLATDPAYWTRGVQPVIDARAQLNAVGSNVIYYYELLIGTQGGALMALAVLGVIAALRGWRPGMRCAPFGLIAWAAVALALYALVRAEGRYVAPFVVLFLASLLAWPRLPDTRGARQLLATVGALIAVWQWIQIGAVNVAEAARLAGFEPGTQDAEVIAQPADVEAHHADNVAIAIALWNDGIAPGDRVAFAGYSYSAYWARLARVRIVAEIRPEEADRLWAMSPARLDELDAALARLGVVALIAEPPRKVQQRAATDWQPLGDTDYLVRDLRNTGLAGRAPSEAQQDRSTAMQQP